MLPDLHAGVLSAQDTPAFQFSKAVVLGLALGVPVLRWLLHSYLFKPQAARLLRSLQCKGQKLKQEVLDGSVEKLCESVWKLLVHSALTCMGLAAVWGQPWLLDTTLLWEGWPGHELTPALQLLYYSALGFYLASIIMLMCWEVRRKDFAAMFIHHVVTTGLVTASLQMRFWRVGAVVMLLHDACDVVMEAAKICNYCQQEELATAFFAVFVVAWVVLRLAAFPLIVIRSTLLEYPRLVPDPPHYLVFNGALLVLLLLHCYWFSLIVRILVRKLSNQQLSDVREEDGDD